MLAASLAAFTAFMLIRPLFERRGYYGPRPLSTGYEYGWVIVVLSLLYGLALLALIRGHGPSLRTILLTAAAVSFPLVVAPLSQSQDVLQYLFQARMQLVYHVNPYLVAPVRFPRDPWTRFLGWRGQVSSYGPLWSLAMAGVVASVGDHIVRAMVAAKVLAAGLEGLTVYGLLRLSRRDDNGFDPRLAVAAFALSPLVVSSIPLSGHADAAVAAAFVWAVVADRTARSVVTSLLLGVATLVKAYAGVVLLVYLVHLWRRADRRTALRATAMLGVMATASFLPYWAGRKTFSGLAYMASQTSGSLSGAVARVATLGWLRLDHDASSSTAGVVVRVIGAAKTGPTLVHSWDPCW